MPKIEVDFTHGQHVRNRGFNGPRGRIYRCHGRRGDYWKVKLASGDWEYPERVVADTDGPYEQRCAECGIPFRSQTPLPLCPQCDGSLGERMDQDQAHAPIWNLDRYRAGVKANQAAAKFIRQPARRSDPTRAHEKHPDGCLCGEDGCTPF